jgi:hypothetical protein
LEKLHGYEEELSVPKLGVVQDVAGRWSSTYSMLSRLVEIKDPLIKTLKTMQKRDLLLTNTDWTTVSELRTALEPFAILTVCCRVSGNNWLLQEHISGSTGALFSSCIPIIINLKNQTSSTPQGTNPVIEEFTARLHSLIQHYFFGDSFLNLQSPRALLYCLLDPRFKALNFVAKEEADAARQLLIDLHSKLHQDPKSKPEVNETH